MARSQSQKRSPCSSLDRNHWRKQPAGEWIEHASRARDTKRIVEKRKEQLLLNLMFLTFAF
jgi:hypothetical protein